MTPARGAWLVGGVAFAVRALAAAWGASRFPPTADGAFYQRLAERIAAGEGYTWLWEDGSVTWASHYPVGYPAAIGGAYAVFGARPVVAMLLAAALGALASAACFDLSRRAFGGLRAGLTGGLAVALHPGLVFYTPAILTEGVTASLVALGAWLASRAHPRSPAVPIALLGALFGLATLVRPQTIVLGPLFAWAALREAAPRTRALGAAATLFASLAVTAPWTLRNRERLGRAAFVSTNMGWNLLIGLDEEARGGWRPLAPPPECPPTAEGAKSTIEASTDACFTRVALRRIAADPGHFLALAPRKVRVTFDYAGAAPWYLHASNPEAFPREAKLALGALETLYERLALLGALVVVAAGRRVPRALVLGLALFCLLPWGSVAWLGLALLPFVGAGRRMPFLARAAPLAVGATLLTHAVFFGSGRYSLVVFPLVTALGAGWLARPPRQPSL